MSLPLMRYTPNSVWALFHSLTARNGLCVCVHWYQRPSSGTDSLLSVSTICHLCQMLINYRLGWDWEDLAGPAVASGWQTAGLYICKMRLISLFNFYKFLNFTKKMNVLDNWEFRLNEERIIRFYTVYAVTYLVLKDIWHTFAYFLFSLRVRVHQYHSKA